MSLIQQMIDAIGSPDRIFRIRVFQRAVLLLIFLNSILFWLPHGEELFGPLSPFGGYYHSADKLLWLLNLLELPVISAYWPVFWGLQLLVAAALFFIPFSRLLWAALYFFTITLFHRAAPIQNGGMTLLVMVLLLMIFAEPGKQIKKQKELLSFVVCTVHFFAFWAILFHILLVYLVASSSKLFGTTWTDGSAWYYVLATGPYRNLQFLDWFALIPVSFKLVSWLTLFFQLAFPLLVWFRKCKRVLLIVGIFFHLVIAFGLGILDFGLIMVVMYIPLLDEVYLFRVGRWLGLSLPTETAKTQAD